MAVPDATRPHETGTVQASCRNGGTSNGSSADDTGAGGTPPKVCMPDICTRIEQRRDATSARINRFYRSLFVIVAPETTPAEIVKIVGAAT